MCYISTNIPNSQILKQMDRFEFFRSQVKTKNIKDKQKKIYVFNNRKSININQKKLNEILDIKHKTPQKRNQSFLQIPIRQYLSEQSNSGNIFTSSYKEDQDSLYIKEKRRQITNKIISNFHISSFRNKNHDPKNNKKKQTKSKSQRKPNSKTSTSQLKAQENTFHNIHGETLNDQKILIFQTNKSSLPHLDKHSISFAQLMGTPTKPRKSRSPLGNSLSFHDDDIEFLKTGSIKGLKIQKSKTKIQKFQNERLLSEPILFNSKSESDQLAEQYYSLIRKTNYRKMTNYVGNKVIRSSFLEIKKKKVSQNQAFKITRINGKSLIKLEEIISPNEKDTVKI